MKGSVTLVGAGPGDPELISVKGLKALRLADVVLYDALVSTQLLSETRAGCKLVYVGKRKGKKEFPQEEINQLLVFYGSTGHDVVRLKGGDPNVFGRGHEEMAYAESQGVEVTVVPGISSAIAAPNAARIPLTKRGVNESFWVITGTLSNGNLSNDIALAAQSSATVIILMGMSHLPQIATLFGTARGAAEPVAVIQSATTSDEKIVTGNVANVVDLVQANQIGTPAVIVIGQVVRHGCMPFLATSVSFHHQTA